MLPFHRLHNLKTKCPIFHYSLSFEVIQETYNMEYPHVFEPFIILEPWKDQSLLILHSYSHLRKYFQALYLCEEFFLLGEYDIKKVHY